MVDTMIRHDREPIYRDARGETAVLESSHGSARRDGALDHGADDCPRILVVDDDPSIRDLVVQVLEDAGYVVDAVANGSRALELVGRRPDLILLDLMMPVMNGWDFCRRLRAIDETRDIPVVVFSATHQVAREAEAAQATDYLAKPFSLDELLTKVGQYAPVVRPANGRHSW